MHSTEGEELDAAGELLARCLESPFPERASRVEALFREHPELAPSLRARLETLREHGIDVLCDPLGEQPFPEQLGEFRLVQRLGGGGMGVVYRAAQTSLGREVALKLIRPEQLYFPGARERFRREVEAAAQLRHPSLAAVHAFGEEMGIPFFAMELVPGATLAEIVVHVAGRAPESLAGADLLDASVEGACRLGDAPPAAPEPSAAFAGTWVSACLRAAEQVARALAHAHERGCLHRDVKPSNVLVAPDGRAVLLDFGLSCSTEELRETRTGSQLGTLLYMAPEQVRGARADARTDVYGLGATLYELLCLQPPFPGGDRAEVERAILAGAPDSPRSRNRGVSPECEAVVLKAIDRDPAQRYAGARELADDLAAAREGRAVRARPPGAWRRARRFVARRPALSVALAACALLIAGVPTALYVQQRAHASELARALERESALRREADREAAANRELSARFVALFKAADPNLHQGKIPSARDMLDGAAGELATAVPDLPQIRARLQAQIAAVYHFLNVPDRSRAVAEQALAALASSGASDPTLDGELRFMIASARLALGDRKGAESDARALVAALSTDAARLDGSLAQARALLASALAQSERIAEAEAAWTSAIESLATADRAPAGLRAKVLADRAGFVVEQWQRARPPRDRAELEPPLASYLQAAELFHGVGDLPLNEAGALAGAGLCSKLLGRLDEAAGRYEQAQALYAERVAPDDIRLAALRVNLSALLEARGLGREAVEPLELAVSAFRRALPPENPNFVVALGNLTGLRFRLGDHERALELSHESLPLQERVFGERHAFVVRGLLNRGGGLLALARSDDAEAAFALARERAVAAGNLDVSWISQAELGLAESRVVSNRVDEAEEPLASAWQRLQSTPASTALRRRAIVDWIALETARGRDAERARWESELAAHH